LFVIHISQKICLFLTPCFAKKPAQPNSKLFMSESLGAATSLFVIHISQDMLIPHALFRSKINSAKLSNIYRAEL